MKNEGSDDFSITFCNLLICESEELQTSLHVTINTFVLVSGVFTVCLSIRSCNQTYARKIIYSPWA